MDGERHERLLRAAAQRETDFEVKASQAVRFCWCKIQHRTQKCPALVLFRTCRAWPRIHRLLLWADMIHGRISSIDWTTAISDKMWVAAVVAILELNRTNYFQWIKIYRWWD